MKVTVRRKENNPPVPVVIYTEYIKLQDALKFANAVESGGMAKTVILDEEVKVNGEVCTIRGKKLYDGDTFSFMGCTYSICHNESN